MRPILLLSLATVLFSACYKPLPLNTNKALVKEAVQVPSRRAAASSTAALAPRGRRNLTLGDILFHLLRRNHRLKVMRINQKIAQAREDSIRRFQNPTLRFMNLSPGIADDDLNNFAIRFRWRPPFPSTYKARRSQLAALSRVKAQEIRTSLYRLVAQARELHARISLIDGKLALYRELAEIRRRSWQFHLKQAQAAVSSFLEADFAKLSYLDTETEITALKTQRATLSSSLMTMLGLGAGYNIASAAAGAADKMAPAPSIKTLVKRTLKRHPALLALDEQQKAQHALLWLEKSRRYPWLSFVQVGWDFSEKKVQNRFFMGLGLRLPLFDWNTGAIRLQNTRLALLKTRKKGLETQLESTIQAAYRRVVATAKAIAHYRKTRPKIEEILLRTRETSKRPGIDLNRIFRIQGSAIRFKLAYLQRLLDHQRALINLDLLTVKPIWRDFGIVLAER